MLLQYKALLLSIFILCMVSEQISTKRKNKSKETTAYDKRKGECYETDCFSIPKDFAKMCIFQCVN